MRIRWDCLCGLLLSLAVTATAQTRTTTPVNKTAPSKTASPSAKPAAAPTDPYLWLEDVTGKKALDWVAKQDTVSKHALAQEDDFRALEARVLEILDSKQKIPTVQKIGDRYYNLWLDQDHARGLWRRTTLEEYRKPEPVWETVLDLDALAKAENENWVWKGASPLPFDDTRCLLSLSRGGADAAVVREFDLTSKMFVSDGFNLPEAKSNVTWRSRDEVYVGTDFGPGSLTSSGYPRIAKLWKRGTPLSAATTVYEAKPEDVWLVAWHDFTPGFPADFIQRGISFYSNELFVIRDGKPVKIDKPDDAEASTFNDWLLIKLRTDWAAGGKTWPAGALLATRLADFLAGKRQFDRLFEPTPRKSLDSYSSTLHAIILNELDNVKSRLYVLRHDGDQWTRTPIPGLPEFGAIDASAVDGYRSDDYFLTTTDFLTPSTLSLGVAGGGPADKLKQAPSYFDPAGLEVTQHEAVSKDGTKVPYFQVAPAGLAMNGSAPTMLTGYGGFEVSSLPNYSGTRGTWLKKGGVYVLANIRGGGEFGPAWHQAGVKAERHHCYEDFIAVAEDLVQRKVTTPKHLGCIGGSNGGLLVGNMLTMRPDLFGAIVCEQPLLDMRRYHKLLAGASWMGEYGDPDKPEEWAYIKGFSPYHNIHKGAAYPPTLFTSSTRDDRVHPGHARKMVAKLQADGHDILYYENVEGGHAGAADHRQLAFMTALAYTFLWRHLSATAAQAP